MGVVYEVKSFRELGEHLEKLLKKKEQRIKEAIHSAAEIGARRIAALVPRAFEELADSIHLENHQHGTNIVVDAPHAAAVEIGSRPHTPPLEPLIKWVKLRGTQGLQENGRPLGRSFASKNADLTTARNVALTIKALQRGKSHAGINIPEQIARSIQHAISVSGTKPSFFVKRSLPDIEKFLLEELKRVMAEEETIT